MHIKVAIIDDKASNRNILKDKLLRHGHFDITLVAEDGKDFVEKMQQLPPEKIPDVALMDLEMPNMDGVDAIAIGSSFFPSVKFVVLTIFDDEDKIFKAIKAGAYGYLLKDESAENRWQKRSDPADLQRAHHRQRHPARSLRLHRERQARAGLGSGAPTCKARS